SENTVVTTCARVDSGVEAEAPPAIGGPIDNTEVYVFDASLAPAPIGVAGEIYIGGKGLARGYAGRSDLTADRFIPNPFAEQTGARLYRTGDLARRTADGQLHFMGRVDQQVKLRGFRIELGEVEAQLVQHPHVTQAAVLLRQESPANEHLVAYVVVESGFEVKELKEFLKQRLPDYMIPTVFVELPSLPLTQNGKVDHARLPEATFDTGVDSERELTPLEKMIADVWSEVLGREVVGVRANFFEIGGDSIKAAIIVNRLQHHLNRIIHVVTIFDAPTVEQYAAYLEKEYADAWPLSLATGSTVTVVDLNELRTLVDQQPLRRTAKPVTQKNPPALFILSTPRSGSTLLRVMLGGHSKFFAPPELELLGYDDLAQRREALSGRQSFWRQGTVRALMQLRECSREEAEREMAGYEDEAMTTQEFYRVLQNAAGASVLVDKTPSYAMDSETLRRAEQEFDGALYLHLTRSPYGMIHSFEEAHLEQIFPRFAQPFSGRKLAEMIWTISEQNMISFLEAVPAERQRQVEFERLVRDPEAVMREICDWAGIEYEAGMIEPYLEKQKRMTDGVHEVGKMLGDIKFHEHAEIDQNIAERWRKTFSKEFLSDVTWEVAAKLGYQRSNSAVRSSENGKAAAEKLEHPTVASGELPPIARVSREASHLPLSFAQERLWFLNQLEPDSPFYNCPAAVRLHGRLDVAAFERTLTEILRRHEVLRTTFPLVDERPVQIVSPPSDVKLTLIDLSALAEVDREMEARELASREARKPFNLTDGPLLRAMLLRLTDNEHILLFSTHHIVSDGWSTSILVREVATLYHAFSKNEPSPLPELPVQYADFAVWQREWLTGKVWEEHLDYWKRQLGGKLPTLSLPV